MFLEIVTPERIVFSEEVTSVAVPGVDGEFQMLDSHAPIISLLVAGEIKIEATKLTEKTTKVLEKSNTDKRWNYTIKGGVIEVKKNKVIILAD